MMTATATDTNTLERRNPIRAARTYNFGRVRHVCHSCEQDFPTLERLAQHTRDTGDMPRDRASELGFCLTLFDRRNA